MVADPSIAPDRDNNSVPDDPRALDALSYLPGTDGGDELGGSGAGTLVDGRKGPDQLFGTPFRDYVAGKEGDDLLYGHGGLDELEGDPGADIYAFQPDGGPELVLDFAPGEGDRLFVEGGRDQVEAVKVDAYTTQFRLDGANAVTVLGLKPSAVDANPDSVFTVSDAGTPRSPRGCT